MITIQGPTTHGPVGYAHDIPQLWIEPSSGGAVRLAEEAKPVEDGTMYRVIDGCLVEVESPRRFVSRLSTRKRGAR